MSTQKRISAPKTYNIKRKVMTWITNVNPGPNDKTALPLCVLLRDVLNVALKKREVKKILNEGKVLIDGKVRKDLKFPVGFLNIVSIPLLKKNYRVIYDDTGRLKCIEAPKSEADLKIVRIKKKIRRKNDYQLSTNDGRTIIVKLAEGKKYNTNDSLLIKVPSQELVKHFPFNDKSTAFITGGKQVGKIGKIKGIDGKAIKLLIDKNEHLTDKRYVFIVGSDKPEVKLE